MVLVVQPDKGSSARNFVVTGGKEGSLLKDHFQALVAAITERKPDEMSDYIKSLPAVKPNSHFKINH